MSELHDTVDISGYNYLALCTAPSSECLSSKALLTPLHSSVNWRAQAIVCLGRNWDLSALFGWFTYLKNFLPYTVRIYHCNLKFNMLQ